MTAFRDFQAARRRRSRTVGVLLWLVCAPGWLILKVMFFAADLGDRLEDHLGDWSWSDVVGSLIVLPLSVLILLSVWLGFGRLAEWFGWLDAATRAVGS